MMKSTLAVCVFLALALGLTFLPNLSKAEEFVYSGSPAFTITYPEGSSEEDKTDPSQVWSIKTPDQVMLQAAVFPIPEGLALKDVAEKGYKPALEKNQKSSGGMKEQDTVKMSENKQITLSEGTKAYYSELTWVHAPSGAPIVTMIVSAYKDGKCVQVAAHPWEGFSKWEKVIKSLKFK